MVPIFVDNGLEVPFHHLIAYLYFQKVLVVSQKSCKGRSMVSCTLVPLF